VSFANKMESSGHPDLVHISEETKKFLGNAYQYREAEEIEGHKTYFILGKRNIVPSASDQRLLRNELRVNTSKQKNLSTTDIPSTLPLTPTSPQSQSIQQNHSKHNSKSLSPSPVLNVRKHRLASISETVSRFLSSSRQTQQQQQQQTSEQQKALLERKCPNPTIVIGITSDDASLSNDKRKNNIVIGTNDLDNESATTNKIINSDNDNSSSSNFIIIDCDKQNDKLVPYDNNNGSGGQQIPLITTSNNNDATKDARMTENNNNDANDSDDEESLNITDLRSYISQSRCDVSPFSRTGSNRSDRNHQSSSNNFHHHHQRSYSQQSNTLSPYYPPQEFSYNLSPSRKDSGIKCNSRRSSIQYQLTYKNSLTITNPNRVSGYFTSSQSSLAAPNDTSQCDDLMMKHLPSPATGSYNPHLQEPGCDTLKACVQHLRKQSDLQLIKCVRDNARSQRSYLVKPPIRKFSLSFENPLMEKTFRSKAHRYECENEMNSSPSYTLATPKLNTFIDVFVLTVIFSMVALSLFLLSPSVYSKEYKVWVCCFVTFSSMILTILFLCTKQILQRRRSSRINSTSIFGWASKYYPWNFFGSILISLPVASILINFALIDIKKFPAIQFYYGLLLFVCLIHFCNFIQLNCWTKNILAFISGILFVLIGYNHRATSISLNDNYQKKFVEFWSSKNNATRNESSFLHWFENYEVELCLDLFLVLILVFLLNREYEIGYRLSFYGNEVANQDKVKVQNMKNQADMLLHNIIPKHVAEELKNTAKYSKNHQDVGILFASIVNFNEMYEESFESGKEYLRVLNELIGGGFCV
jgi:adenylate cyclase 9